MPGSGRPAHERSSPGTRTKVVDELTDVLLLEAKTAHRPAVHCIAVPRDVRATDDQRETAINKIARQFDTEAIPVVNKDR